MKSKQAIMFQGKNRSRFCRAQTFGNGIDFINSEALRIPTKISARYLNKYIPKKRTQKTVILQAKYLLLKMYLRQHCQRKPRNVVAKGERRKIRIRNARWFVILLNYLLTTKTYSFHSRLAPLKQLNGSTPSSHYFKTKTRFIATIIMANLMNELNLRTRLMHKQTAKVPADFSLRLFTHSYIEASFLKHKL